MNNYNYQLYRSNTGLGGQLAWDIILTSNDSSSLIVNDFHLAPISNRVPYNRYSVENLLNYSHLENIKTFYDKIEGSFYKPYANPILTSEEPFIVDDNYDSHRSKMIDLHDNTLEMGLKRIPYSWYSNQFSFFCPVWLSSYTKTSPLVFTFITKTKGNNVQEDQEISRKILKFKSSYTDYHNKFVNYFNSYTESIKMDNENVNKNVINIDLQNNSSCIRGVDVKNGIYVGYKNIQTLVDNMVGSEKLLMDNDSLIISSFEKNNLIACQLFNFNFIFDVEELIPHNLLNLIWGANITVDVEVGLESGEEITTLELKDFYTNYEYIPCKKSNQNFKSLNSDVTTEEESKDVNVFDLIKDNQNIDLINKNKIVQNIIHWSLENNNDYIYNLYTGFGGYLYLNDVDIERNLHNYQDSLNIWDKTDSTNTSGYNWVNIKTGENINSIIKTIKGIYLGDSNSYIINGSEWCKHVKFTEDMTYSIKCSAIIVNEDVYESYLTKYPSKDYYNTFNVSIAETGDFILHIILRYSQDQPDIYAVVVAKKDNVNKLLFYNFSNFLKTSYANITWSKIWDLDNNSITPQFILEDWAKWLNSVSEPDVYYLTLLGYNRADSPSTSTTELNHYNQKGKTENIIRYCGNIIPTFVEVTDNIIYTKKKVHHSNKDELSVFTKYINTGFKKLYKSIGYYPWRELGDVYKMDRSIILPEGLDLPYEYNIFSNSSVIILKSKFIYTLYNSDEMNEKDAIKKVISEVYNIEQVSDQEDYIDYISTKYNIYIDWEYNQIQENNIRYNYIITFSLK